MIEITEIKKNKSSYSVTIGNNKHSLSEDTLLRFQIYVGKIITGEELTTILKQENDHQTYAKALNFISFKERTESEVKQYLFKKTEEYSQVFTIIEKLKIQGYLDDTRYTSHFIDSYVARGKGKIYIKQKLIEKGIDKLLIEGAIQSISEETQLENILKIVEKELPRLHKYPINKQKQMMMQKLQRDGYPHNLISKVIQSQELSSDHSALLTREIEKLTRKYKGNVSKEVKQKMIQSLLIKGFDFHDISQAMKPDEN